MVFGIIIKMVKNIDVLQMKMRMDQDWCQYKASISQWDVLETLTDAVAP